MTNFRIELLGGPRVAVDGRSLPLNPGKGLALLSFLAAERGAHRRDALCALLWPDLDPDAARHNLRQRLSELRAGVGANLFLATQQTLQLHPEAAVEVDIDRFTGSDAMAHGKRCALAEATARLALYRGPFLAGLSTDDLNDFHQWVIGRREALHRHALSLHESLIRCHAERAETEQALYFARRLIELDPWNEAGQRAVMRLLAEAGEQGAALRHYERYRSDLARELNALPDAATRDLFAAIRLGSVPSSVVPPLAAPETTPSSRERRRVTVLHAALAFDPTDDPEEAADRLEGPQQICRDILRTAKGHLLPWYSGGVVAYFGYPEAREGAARAAAGAAREISRRLGAGVKVGLHTGGVVTRGDQPDPTGLTTATALRAAQAATAGSIILSATTRRLVDGYFDLELQGELSLEGQGAALPLYRLGDPTGARDRLEASPLLTPFVGREEELHQLCDAWSRARSGKPSVWVVRGEPGIGKSRLVREFSARAGAQQMVLRAASASRDTALLPLALAVTEWLGVAETEKELQRRELRRRTAELGLPAAVEAGLADLLGLEAAPGGVDFTALQRKTRLAEAAVCLWSRMAEEAPLLLLLEDLHWFDPSTLEVLDRMLAATHPPSPLMMVATARPDASPAWSDERVTCLELAHLSPGESRRMVELLSRGRGLAPERLAEVARLADGIPLFVEEVTVTLLARHEPGLPESLDELLSTRLDRLGAAKRLAQLASLLGREFDLTSLQRVAGAPAALQLAALTASGLVQPQGEGRFQFKHALVQEAAYRSLARADREEGHRQIVALLRAGDPGLVERQPELLARHLTGAGEPEEAIRYWLRAGLRAQERWANLEAIAHLRQGLALLSRLPPGAPREHLELDLLMAIGKPLIHVNGFGAVEAGEIYGRALALVERLEREEARFAVVWGWWLGSGCRGGHDYSRRLAEEMVVLADANPDPWLAVSARSALGNTLFWLGEFPAAKQVLEEAIERAAPLAPRRWDDSGEDPAVTARGFLAWTLWFLGERERSLAVGHEGVKRARALNHPNSLGYALAFLALLYRLRREPAEAMHWASQTTALGTAFNIQIWSICGLSVQGWATAQGGDETGIEPIATAVAVIREAQPSVIGVFAGMLAEAEMALGRYDRALAAVEEGLASVVAKEERWFEAEFQRMRHDCLMALTPCGTDRSSG